jgi:hypothetical protein
MAIILCPKCSKSISEYAKFCPHCLNDSIRLNVISKTDVVQEQSKESIIPDLIETASVNNLNEISWYKKWWGIAIIILVLLSIIGNLSGNKNTKSSSNISTSCQGYGDESYIRSKMSQMNRDILELNKIGDRKYYVRYISWSSGTAINGDQVLDYSNSPCND